MNSLLPDGYRKLNEAIAGAGFVLSRHPPMLDQISVHFDTHLFGDDEDFDSKYVTHVAHRASVFVWETPSLHGEDPVETEPSRVRIVRAVEVLLNFT